MRRADSTEAVLKKEVIAKPEMKSDIAAWQPLTPKDVIDYEETGLEINDPIEALGVLLKVNEVEESAEEWLKKQWIKIYSWEDWEKIFIDSNWLVIKDIIRWTVNQKYWGKTVFLKKGDFEIYWDIVVRPFNQMLSTRYGRISCPLTTVNWTAVLCKWDNCLTQKQKETYELYNNKEAEYSRMDLEKKIMGDLIAYAQLWVKPIEETKSLFDKIEQECKRVGSIKKIEFKNQVFKIHFDWRYVTDSAWNVEPLVLPPFTLIIDFAHKTLSWEWYHPHRMGWGNLCLWWELTKIKDVCFQDKDIYGLVMAMVQFWNTWNSSDVGATWERHPWYQIINYLRNNHVNIEEIPIAFIDIYRTVSKISSTWFIDGDYSTFFRQQLRNKDFVEAISKFLKKNSLSNVIYWSLSQGWDDEDKELAKEYKKAYWLSYSSYEEDDDF